jgi:acyl carrier protein
MADDPAAPMTREELLGSVTLHAERFLPTAMLPTTWTLLARLPLTVNGKLDRKELESRVRTPEPSAGRAPRSECEAALCELVGRVLGLQNVSIDDDFFDLGGTSLSAIKLVSAVNRAFGIQFKLRTLLRNRTLEAMAERIQECGRSRADT